MKQYSTQTIFMLLGIILLLTACRKEDDKLEITTEDAANMVAGNLSDQSDGLEEDVNAGWQRLKADTNCGRTINYVRNLDVNRGSRSFTYQAQGKRTRICENDSLVAFDFSSTFNTTYNGPRWSSDGSGSRNGRLSEVNSKTNYYLWNGNSTKDIAGVLIGRSDRNINATLTFSSEIEIDKATELIDGGYSDFTLSGSGDDIESFSYNGRIEYLGNRNARITINGEVNLSSY
jgi:hypothetical protein